MSGFQNPVLPGFFPDPSVCRVGNEYFLVTSTFTYFPGVPIFRSRNLVDWTQIGNVLDRREQLDLRSTQGNTSLGVFAPTLRHHDGRFWMITTVCTGDAGLRNFFVTAEDPVGPWSDPITVDQPTHRRRTRSTVDGHPRRAELRQDVDPPLGELSEAAPPPHTDRARCCRRADRQRNEGTVARRAIVPSRAHGRHLYTWAVEVGLGVLESMGIEPQSPKAWADMANRFARSLQPAPDEGSRRKPRKK